MKRTQALLLICSLILLSTTYSDAQISQPANVEDTGTFATVYIYRPKIFKGSFGKFVLRLDDGEISSTPIATMSNGKRMVYALKQEGTYRFWGETETVMEATLNPKKGKVYYLRCGVTWGVHKNRPILEFVPEEIGKAEYAKLAN